MRLSITGATTQGQFRYCVRWPTQGNSVAQYKLGVIYHNGQGVPEDDAQAAVWYRKAAEQGDAAAQTYLGWMYDIGYGVLQNYAQATVWYRKAVEQRDADAPGESHLEFRSHVGGVLCLGRDGFYLVAGDSRRGRMCWIVLSNVGTVWTTRALAMRRCTTFMRFWR